jgi:DNA replication protein DnaC
MLNEPTIEKLRGLHLEPMARAWEEQQRASDVAGLSFDERFGLLVDAEWMHRENARFARYVKDARLRLSQACIEDIEYAARRELERTQIRQLAACRWVHEHQNVLVSGATGTGKTYISCALAHQACRKGYRVAYRRASRLLEELRLARASGTYSRLLGKLARLDVLVIDDWALAPLTDEQRRDIHEILEDRYKERSTIVASQLPSTKWHEYLSDPTLADAICDRLLHNAHRIVLKGPSRRKEEPTTNS